MNYSKTSLTVEEQADLLISRGLTAARADLVNCLSTVNYYRLTGYLHPYRQRDADGQITEDFRPGTTFNQVLISYRFDARLRAVIMEAIDQIEVGLRTRLVYHFVLMHGAFRAP